MLQKLMDSPVAWLILAIISVVSFIIAIYEIVKKKSVKELSYYDSSYVIVKNNEDSISKIAIMYDGREVDNVTISKFAIWNSGTETLKTDDLVEEKMIKVKAENGAKILDAQIIAETDEYNKFTVLTNSQDTATVSFDWTAKQDGCVLQLLHTGDDSDISLDCEIKGGNKLKWMHNMFIPLSVSDKMWFLLSAILCTAFFPVELFVFLKDGGGIIFTIFPALGAILCYYIIYKNFKFSINRIPKKLRPFMKNKSKYFNKQ